MRCTWFNFIIEHLYQLRLVVRGRILDSVQSQNGEEMGDGKRDRIKVGIQIFSSFNHLRRSETRHGGCDESSWGHVAEIQQRLRNATTFPHFFAVCSLSITYHSFRISPHAHRGCLMRCTLRGAKPIKLPTIHTLRSYAEFTPSQRIQFDRSRSWD
jgi:hypothetical protein